MPTVASTWKDHVAEIPQRRRTRKQPSSSIVHPHSFHISAAAIQKTSRSDRTASPLTPCAAAFRTIPTEKLPTVTSQPSRGHHHHHRPPRPRSVSRSSSSPSPPPASLPTSGHVHSSPRGSPLPLSSAQGLSREKRKSFTAGRANAAGGHGHRTRALSRGALPNLEPGRRASGDALAGREGGTGNGHAGAWERPGGELDGEDVGFSTQYGASASSLAGVSGSEGGEFLAGMQDGETEVEKEGRTGSGTGAGGLEEWRRRSGDWEPVDRSSTPLASAAHRGSTSSRRAQSASTHPASPSFTLLPFTIGPQPSNDLGKRRGIFQPSITVTRRRCENAIVLGGVLWGIWTLGARWGEKALAGEISLLVGMTILYSSIRFHPTPPRLLPPPQSSVVRPHSPSLAPPNWGTVQVRERVGRASTNNGLEVPASPSLQPKDDYRSRGVSGADEEGLLGFGGRGAIWGTEEREYRDCLDDGVFYALLLAPLVAAALLHAALTQLASQPISPLGRGWNIEFPLVLPSTPIRGGLNSTIIHPPTDTIRALSALATSRRNLVQLFTLCSFVLLVHLARSLHLEVKQHQRAAAAVNTSPKVASVMLERVNSESFRLQAQQTAAAGVGMYWLRKGEWRRTKSVVGFSFLVSAGCLVVKAVTAYIGRGVWSDMSPSDIVIATLFYQFSIYVCVRLARRGFTLGELATVCNAATALFMETINLTRMKISIFRTPYIKTYRLPTPLLTFQLALIPGSLLAGFLLSPLLYLSRNLAQKPAHRLRLPHEKPMHRRLLALGFYAGSILVCGGIVGLWTWWCLGGRNPWTWAVYWVLEGQHAWTRPALMAYWGALAAISVAGWERQLNRARKHRRYVVPGQAASRGEGTSTSHGGSGRSGTSATQSGVGAGAPNPERFSGVASQMMDAADQRLPTLSVNARRKSFHALAVVMFIPGIAVDPAFTHLSFSVAFAAFNFAEFIRYFALWPFGVKVHLFLNEFLDHKDSGTAILSHFYLLAGCASPLWLEGPSEILSYFGVLSLGIGDALASIVGRWIGQVRWCTAFGKTVEGSVAFFLSVLLSSALMWAFGVVDSYKPTPYVITTALATLLEAFSAQNDNLILPMFGWAMGTLLGV